MRLVIDIGSFVISTEEDFKENTVWELVSTVQSTKLHGNFKPPGFFFSLCMPYSEASIIKITSPRHMTLLSFLLIKNVYDEE